MASIGVATVSYVACLGGTTTSGNLVAPATDGSVADVDARSDAFVTSGNLVAPIPDASDAGRDVQADAGPADAPADAPGEGG